MVTDHEPSSSSPTRGAPPSSSTPPPSTETAVDKHSTSALHSAKRNLRYLYDPSSSSHRPAHLRTRALLRSLRFFTIFLFWRLVRYAKYVAIGSLVAAVGAGAFGSVVSGAAFVVAPTGIAGTIVAGTVWGLGSLAATRLRKRWGREGTGYGEREMEWQERKSAAMREDVGAEAMPW